MDAATRVKELISEHLSVNPNIVTPEASIVDDLGADSLDRIEMVMTFEEEFEIFIDDDAEADGIRTVGDAIRLVEAKLAAEGRPA